MKKKIHTELHKKLVTLLYETKSGHIGSSLSCLDIMAEVMIYHMEKADKFILSKGHAAPALYVVLNYLKKITNKELYTFHMDGTKFPAHPPNFHLNDDIPFATGGLGHGLSLSCGIAQAYKYYIKEKKEARVYCLISDGECNEGQTWEAAQYASQYKLSNLTVLIDKNRLQAFGRIEDVLGDSASREKWEAFGFEVWECDGHKVKEIETVLKQKDLSKSNKPKVIIFNTVKGHGISFMEDKIEWHYNTLSSENFDQAMNELEKM